MTTTELTESKIIKESDTKLFMVQKIQKKHAILVSSVNQAKVICLSGLKKKGDSVCMWVHIITRARLYIVRISCISLHNQNSRADKNH